MIVSEIYKNVAEEMFGKKARLTYEKRYSRTIAGDRCVSSL
mgnify:CR=1 FL=1